MPGQPGAPGPAPAPFLVVEYVGQGLPLADWTRAHPGTTVDLILQRMRESGNDVHAPGIALARGMDAEAHKELRALLDRHYAPHETLRADVRRGEWLGRLTIHAATMRLSPATKAVALNQHRFGPPWSHVDDGIVHMRMQLLPGQDGGAALQAVQRELAAQGAAADAQATLQEISRHDYGIWEELVQASIGLRP